MISSEKLPPKPDSWFYSIQSPNKLAWILGFPIEDLEKLAKRASRFYAPYWKRKPNSKPRKIANPQGFLKEVQTRINKRILSRYSFPDYIIGGVKGRNPLEHPLLHIKKPIVATIDVRDCFPSISNSKIFHIWKDTLECSPTVARLLTQLTTFEGSVPLGSPTSGALANLALLPCVEQVKKMTEYHRMRLSQYVDDQAISGDNLPTTLIASIVREFSKAGFSINRKKIRVMRAGDRQQVTKKNVNNVLSVPRHVRADIVADLKKLASLASTDETYSKLFNRINGRILYLKQLHPEQAEKLKDRLRLLSIPAPNPSMN